MPTNAQSNEAAERIADHPVVSQEEWLTARKALLKKEKEFTRQKDALSAERRALPWVKIEKPYIFEGPTGEETLADLFAGRDQLIVYHFMLGPDWDEGCMGCSFLADHIDGANLHLPHAGVTLVVVSRAPLAKIEAYKKRMGWKFKWVSSFTSEFNFDFQVSHTEEAMAKGDVYYNYDLTEGNDELPGASVFYKDASGNVFHTYSTYARGTEQFAGTYNFLDLAPKGRGENGPNFNMSDWLKRHDQYATAPAKSSCCSE